MMKLLIAIVSNEDAGDVSNALVRENFYVTRLATTGGFLRAGNATLLIGTETEHVQQALDIIGQESRRRTQLIPTALGYDVNHVVSTPVEVTVGGATVFVLDVEQFIKI